MGIKNLFTKEKKEVDEATKAKRKKIIKIVLISLGVTTAVIGIGGAMTIFLEQCDGCPDLEIEVKQQTLYADASPYLDALQITCRDIDKCAHLIKRLEKGD